MAIDYVKIAASKVTTAGKLSTSKPPRYLFYGRNKKGKTRLGSTAPRVLILDPEYGTKELDPDQPVWPIHQWKDMDEFFHYAKTKDCQSKYDWICVDGMTRITNMAMRYSMKQAEERDLDRIPGTVDRRVYGTSGELIKGALFNFHNLPYGIIYTAAERMEEVKDNQFDTEDEDLEEVQVRYVPDLPKGVRSNLNAIVDCIGRIYVVQLEGKEGEKVKQRRLWIAPTEAYDTGYRSRLELPNYLKNPTVPKLERLLKTGKVTARG
jgi:hypothetical protein